MVASARSMQGGSSETPSAQLATTHLAALQLPEDTSAAALLVETTRDDGGGSGPSTITEAITANPFLPALPRAGQNQSNATDEFGNLVE